jgi:uracil phosphoribosyltransferase
MYEVVIVNNGIGTTMFQATTQRGAEAMAYFAVALLLEGEKLTIETPMGQIVKVMFPL